MEISYKGDTRPKNSHFECSVHVQKMDWGKRGVRLWRSTWMKATIPFGDEVNTQFSTFLPTHSAGFHGGPSAHWPGGSHISHLEPSPWKRHKEICWYMLRRTFLFRVQIRDKRGHTPASINVSASQDERVKEETVRFILKVWVRVKWPWWFYSHLMDDLRHWQLVHIWIHLFKLISIHKPTREKHTERLCVSIYSRKTVALKKKNVE